MGGMMASVLTEGRAESGYGVVITGFFCPVREFGLKLEDLKKNAGIVDKIASSDEAGYSGLVVCSNAYASGIRPFQIAVYRKVPDKFFSDLSPFLKSIRAGYVQDISLIQGLGYCTMVLLYSPAPGMGETGA